MWNGYHMIYHHELHQKPLKHLDGTVPPHLCLPLPAPLWRGGIAREGKRRCFYGLRGLFLVGNPSLNHQFGVTHRQFGRFKLPPDVFFLCVCVFLHVELTSQPIRNQKATTWFTCQIPRTPKDFTKRFRFIREDKGMVCSLRLIGACFSTEHPFFVP